MSQDGKQHLNFALKRCANCGFVSKLKTKEAPWSTEKLAFAFKQNSKKWDRKCSGLGGRGISKSLSIYFNGKALILEENCHYVEKVGTFGHFQTPQNNFWPEKFKKIFTIWEVFVIWIWLEYEEKIKKEIEVLSILSFKKGHIFTGQISALETLKSTRVQISVRSSCTLGFL